MTDLKTAFTVSLYLLLFCFSLTANAQNKPSIKTNPALTANVEQWMENSGNLRFLENKGQMADVNGKTDHNLLLKVSGNGMDVYITTKGISYVFTEVKEHEKKNKLSLDSEFNVMNDSITMKYCRADMDLVGATISKENILKEGKSDDFENYYLSQCPKGALNVHSYQKITIKNIYPDIDWELFTNSNTGIKYNFVVHPGADASQIKLKYKWTDQPELQKDGSIIINTPLGQITEGPPLSYTDENEPNKIETNYIIKNNEISFDLSYYNKTSTLIIDPVLVWATHYGGLAYATGPRSINSDGTNVYVTGQTYTTNFPVFNPGGGAYFQGTILGWYDAFILQFNTSGVRKWATYYGGDGSDFGYSISSDGANVWVTGIAGQNLPVINPGSGVYFQGVHSGGYEGFIAKFNPSGILNWATYYGGTGDDQCLSISSDGTNVWVTGRTRIPYNQGPLPQDVPLFNPGGGAYFQGTSTSGNQDFDALILQFDTSGVRKWATLYGGNDDMFGYSISSDGTNVWVLGRTMSTTFPVFNPGGGAYFQGTNGGTQDAIILQFNTSGVRKWATYYGGSSWDYCSQISSDGTNVWVTGRTGSIDFPVYNPGGGAYFQGTSATGVVLDKDAYILQFDTFGVRKWATYYGGASDEFGLSISSDGTDVWVSGKTGSSDLPVFDPGCSYFKGTTAGTANVFLLQFDNSGVRKWATYYGESQDGWLTSISSDGTNAWLTSDVGYAGIYPTINPGGGAYFEDIPHAGNMLLAKFSFEPPLNIASPDSICAGDPATLTVTTSDTAATYVWTDNFGGGPSGDSSSIIVNQMLNTS
jgi:hypothetical protein